MNTVGINILCLVKRSCGTFYHFCDFSLTGTTLLKTHLSVILCSHSGNPTALTTYQFHKFIHNAHTGTHHPRKGPFFAIFIFCSESVP